MGIANRISSSLCKTKSASPTMARGSGDCCYIFSTIFAMIIVLCVVSSMIISLTFYPSKNVQFHAIQASLTQFNLTNNNTTLYFNFIMNITARNPNKNTNVYYRRITAIAWYKDNAFAYVTLTPFDQGQKNTTLLTAAFDGSSVIQLRPQQLAEYFAESSLGIYNDLAVDLHMRIGYKYGRFRSSSFNPPIVQCRHLRVALSSNNSDSNAKSIASFSDANCIVDGRYFFEDRKEII